MKKIILLVLIISFISCKSTKNNNVVNYEDPLKEISWLKDIKRQFDMSMSMSKKQIIQYYYNGEIVFLINNCVKCTDTLSYVYDSNKNIVCEFGGIAGKNTCSDFNKKATEKKILYSD